ncbi:MAG: DNA-processing protein DprA [Xenococcaceae cyanobacterium]
MNNHILSCNTQAMLLLCASFGSSRTIEPKPLSLGEYNNLASWLHENDLTPQDLLDSTIQDKLPQLEINQLESHRILALLNRGVMLGLAVEKWTNQGLWIIGRGDREYPQALKDRLRYQAPAILYGVGNQQLLSQGGLAVVGSRNADNTALEYTERLAYNCAQQGIQVISGGAKGVDRASMLSALEMGGTVIGVMANSLAKTAIDKKYRTRIQEGKLTLISTYDPDVGFSVGNAMGRNKYIYALADYALVISSTANKGGTWAGATEALAKIKDVPVLVRIEENTELGNQKLLAKGAIPLKKYAENLPLKDILSKAVLDFYNQKSSKMIVEQPSLLDNLANPKYPNDLTERDNQTVQTKNRINEKFIANQKQSSLSNEDYKKSQQQQPLLEYKPQDIYQAVLPFILQQLKKPKDDKVLAQILEVQIGQMRLWLKRAVAEGLVKKNSKPVTYEVIQNDNLSSLYMN